jgi:Ser-tRNA(Ala) deacylase AlaX
VSDPPGYERDPYRRELTVRVLCAGVDGERPWAALDDTICYPEGGGQPTDRGWLAGVEVVDVQRVEGETVHYLAAAVKEGEALLELDWARRFDHMQQHTAQHLLSAIALARFGWATRSFHIGAERCDIELDVAAPTREELLDLEEAVAAEIRAARPVRCRRVTAAEYARLAVRSRGLPAGHRGDVRLVEIEGVDLNTCGGTHLAGTAELETVKLVGVESLRGGSRLYWVAGGRVRRRLAAHEERTAALRSRLDTGDEELATVVDLKLEQLADLRREHRRNLARLAELEAQDLASRGAKEGGAVEGHFEGADAAFLQQVAKRFADLQPRGLALLTAAGAGGALFALAAGGESPVDLQALGLRIAESLSGRGGGRAPVFQGKAGSLERRGAAWALLCAAVGGGGSETGSDGS